MRRGITAITVQLMNAAKSNAIMAKGKASGGTSPQPPPKGGEKTTKTGAAWGHSVSGADLWKKITYFGVFPTLIIIAAFVVASISREEFERPEFRPYEHMRIRRKAFPWDAEKTFFHNKHRNALPDGYEQDEEEEAEGKEGEEESGGDGGGVEPPKK